eukprot:TRINITY_DN3776_c1_g1_i1.p1 TRINITY_DN3776_c1_g1~~TRINITY_DN3776_c1_g1_i1.p1  ORF type:complete len:185 (-),score=27.65 TRINITY_DN3776_c1_g1_i1:66-620(-)
MLPSVASTLGRASRNVSMTHALTYSTRVNYHTSSMLKGDPPAAPPQKDKDVKTTDKKEIFSKEDVLGRFEEIYKIRDGTEDHGIQKKEREVRASMKRVAKFPGDFHSLEEKHILYGPRGTLANPTIVESVFPTRTVGCAGSEETQVHEILWHVVKREKPLICLECGQVFKLVTPEGEHVHERHH